MNEFTIIWTWDVYHIGSTIFFMLIVGAVIWIIKDSISKQRKANGTAKRKKDKN